MLAQRSSNIQKFNIHKKIFLQYAVNICRDKMGRKAELSEAKRSAILALQKNGSSYREIAKLLKVSYSAVKSTVDRYKQGLGIKSRKRVGRPRKTNAKQDKQIVLKSKRNRFKTARDIRSDLIDSNNIEVSVSTIQRRLRSAGLNGRVATKKPLLRKVNKLKRLAWAKKHRNWTPADWKKVLFTDESKFELFSSKRRIYVRRQVHEKMSEQCIIPTVKHGGGSIMVWGCFAGTMVGDLVKIDGIMDKKVYHKILQYHAIPSGRRLVGDNFVMQQDNDPKHTSKYCTDYLKSKEEKNHLQIMEWPSQSPDCNPIEYLWDHLDRKIRDKPLRNKNELWATVESEWKNIEEDVLQKLIDRMPRICKAILKVRGGYFDETSI